RRKTKVVQTFRSAVSGRPEGRHYFLYVLLKPFRVFVTVNEPSVSADTFSQYALPLCAGGGVAPGPGAGAGVGATGMAACWSSTELAMNIPGAVYSCPTTHAQARC